MKSGLKYLFAQLVYRSGLWRAASGGRAVVILTYHRVCREGETAGLHPGMYVTAATFQRHMGLLRKFFRFLSAAELEDRLRTGRVPDRRPACLVTFDDGWKDNLRHAWPVLAGQDLPAVVFVMSDTVRRGVVPDELRFLLMLENGHLLPRETRSRIRNLLDPDRSGYWESGNGDSTAELDRLVGVFKDAPPDRRREIIARGADLPLTMPDRFLAAADLRAPDCPRRLEIGSHTVTHASLDRLDAAAKRREIHSSFVELQAEFPCFYPILAYPSGRYDPEAVRIAGESGYRLAVTARPGRVDPSDRPLALPRVSMHEDVSWCNALFVCRLLKLPGF
jgi:peptidoglycan/xylan/chitin deacetylase (PgdA/CDA1 family)